MITAMCADMPIPADEKELQRIFLEVKNSAYSIIEKKGETSYGIGLALTGITQAVMNDENAVLSVSSLVNNYFGIDDVYLSVPAVVNNSGIREVLKMDLNEREVEELKQSAGAVKKVIKETRI